MIVKSLSGHMYYQSAHETDSSCGNCDGARCDYCHESYRIFRHEDLGVWSSFAAAEEVEKKLNTELEELVPGVPARMLDADDFWMDDSGKLMVTYYHYGTNPMTFKKVEGNVYQAHDIGPDPSGPRTIECDQNAAAYWTRWEIAAEAWVKWQICPCTDKSEPAYGNSCDVHHKCGDHWCWFEVSNRQRTTRKVHY